MKTAVKTPHPAELTKEAFGKIAPFWPLKNLIAVNPLQGLEDRPIEEALKAGAASFQQGDLPEKMLAVNRETIKWLQAFFDQGQATIAMPLRSQGLYAAWKQLAVHDSKLHGHDKDKQDRLRALPESAEEAATDCLNRLGIGEDESAIFATLMLTTLPGWAAYVKYRTEWAGLEADHAHPVTQADYLAMRLVITTLLWPQAKRLLDWHAEALKKAQAAESPLVKMQAAEKGYRKPLLDKLAAQPIKQAHAPEAQVVFCIDVRSEPFRRALESTGDYQTLGFAGFFGVPVKITDAVTGETHASCPVLLTPKHEVVESPCCCGHEELHAQRQGHERLSGFKRLYQSVKYTFTTPFALVEAMGLASGVWMGLRSLAPQAASKLRTAASGMIRKPAEVEPSLESISTAEQCAYAEGALRTMGLTHLFAPVVVFCGHGSTTQNNAYATALDCGACGGRHGASNARILAGIMNRAEVRSHLAKQGIEIPEGTRFYAAEHNTTTDEVTLYGDANDGAIQKLRVDLEKARQINSAGRLKQLKVKNGNAHDAWLRAQDWAQVRPEWGLARNAAFIVAPRDLSAGVNLEGRCFLHSYDYTQDSEGRALTVILTAPMVVAEWINTQYLFSTLDNVAYGGGSKITKNITGKMGIMQGNASDLMTGLPLQSVHLSDEEAYHEPQRLMAVVYAPRTMLDRIIQAQAVLQKLFGNGWVQLACIEPEDRKTYYLNRDLTWKPAL